MRYRLFQYPLPVPPELEDLNAFIASQRIAAVTQYLVQTAGGGMLVFVVETVAGPAPRPGPGGTPAPKVDYREELSADQFVRFSRLRDERKRWAEAEGLPVYTIFTNAQLAAMARGSFSTLAELGQIEGVGQARLEKYGTRLLVLLGPPLPPEGAP
jgi:superfamily II DNA helicase RecQ